MEQLFKRFETSDLVNLRGIASLAMATNNNDRELQGSDVGLNEEKSLIEEAQNLRIPEYAPVILLEQFIFYLFSLGLIVIVRGQNGTLAPMPTSVYAANVLSFVLSLIVFMLFLFLRFKTPSILKYVGVAQEVAFVFMFMYNMQFVIFTLILRIFHSELEETENAIQNDWFIMLFNASKTDPYGHAITTLHMVITLVLCVFFVVLFITSHSFLRRIYHSKHMDWMLALSMLFIQSQFFLFHIDHMHHSTETCDMFICKESHTLGALGTIILVWLLDLYGSVYKQKFVENEAFDSMLFLKYVASHVFFLPVSGLVLVHLVPWLKEQWFYAFNVLFLILLFSTRALSARNHFIRKTKSPSTPRKYGINATSGFRFTASRKASNSINQENRQSASLFGTPQPKYFFRTPGRRNKHD